MGTTNIRSTEAGQRALTLLRTKIETFGFEAGIDQSVANGADGRTMAAAMLRHIVGLGIRFDAIGARGVYGQALAIGTCLAMEGMIQDCDVGWFAVRDAQKDHGLRGRISEGAPIAGKRVVLIDTLAQPIATPRTCSDVAENGGATIRAVLPVVGGPEVQDEMQRTYPWVLYAPLFSRDELYPPAPPHG